MPPSREVASDRKSVGGRPRAAVPHSQITAWVPTAVHDRLVRMATARDVSVSRLVNRIVLLQLEDDPPPD